MTCPTLYYHFGSKEGLAQALLLCPLGKLRDRLQDLLETELEPVDRLVEATAAYFAFNQEDPDRARFLYAVLFGPLNRGLAEKVDGLIRQSHAALRQIVERLAGANLIALDLVSDVTLAVRGQVVIRSVDFLYRGGVIGPEIARRTVLMVLNGYLNDEGRARLQGCPTPSS